MDSQGKEKVLYNFASLMLVLVFLWQSYISLDKYMGKNTGYHRAQKVLNYKRQARVPYSKKIKIQFMKARILPNMSIFTIAITLLAS